MTIRRTAILALLAAAAAAAAISISIAIARSKTIDAGEVVAFVDGVPIAYGEFAMMLAANRAKVAGYFQAVYGAGTGRHFWTGEYNGEVPLDKLKQAALDDAVEIKIVQMMAKEMGLTEDISYEAFRRGFLAENKRRAEIAASGGILIGPKQYEEAQYYSLVHSNLVGELKKRFHSEAAMTDDEALEYYHSHQHLYKLPDTITLEIASAEGEDAENILKAVKEGLAGGQDMEQAAEPFKDRIRIAHRVLNAETARGVALAEPALLAHALHLDAGQTSDVFYENGQYLLIRCADREEGGYRPFEEVKKAIRGHLAGQAYEREIERRKLKAKVIVNEVYYRIGASDIGAG